MRENPKEQSVNYEDGSWTEKWYLEWIPEHIDEGVRVLGAYAEVPVSIMVQPFDEKKATKRQRQIINGYVSTDVLTIMTTRDDHPFKREDLILDNLDTFPNGKVGKRKHPFMNFNRIRDVDDMVDKEFSMNNLRFSKVKAEKKWVLFTI